jgi:outer membrane protein OmpA-like peptidoglycan-associated protein
MRRRTFLAAAPVLVAAACTSAPSALPPIAVFFTADSASLDAEAQEVVVAAARRAKTMTGPVYVVGYAGPAGGVAYNVALSQARAQHVADLLAREGVARDRISIVARGPVPFDSIATEARRVEIRIGA